MVAEQQQQQQQQRDEPLVCKDIPVHGKYLNIWKTSITKDETLSFVVLAKHYVFFFWFKSKQSGFAQTRLKQNSSKEHKKKQIHFSWSAEIMKLLRAHTN